MLHQDGVIFDVNTALLKMLGYQPDELIGCKYTDFVDKAFAFETSDFVDADQADVYEIRMNCKDGRSFPAMVHVRMQSTNGQDLLVLAICVLTEQKEVEEEIRALWGILPIFSVCKKIRDDQGYWNQIEEYIEHHSEAFFSHSLCSSCEHELYGDQN